MLIRNSKYVDPFTSKVGVIIFSVHAVIPFGIMGVLVKKRDQLELSTMLLFFQNLVLLKGRFAMVTHFLNLGSDALVIPIKLL